MERDSIDIERNPPVATPYWWDATPRQQLSQQDLPAKKDLVIVGSGYAGMSAAISAAKKGADVLVLESGLIGSGASTRNGGAVGEGLRISYSAMLRKLGLQTANDYYDETHRAHLYLKHLLNEHQISCDYRVTGRLMAAHTQADYEALAADLKARKQNREFDADMIPEAEIRSVLDTRAYKGGRLVHSDGNLDPGKFHEGLFQAAIRAGVEFRDRTTVLGVQREGKYFKIRTAAGQVAAKNVIMAVNAYTSKADKWFANRIVPVQSQVIATEPMPDELAERLIPKNRQIGDTRNLHNYFRRSPDGSRIIFGGRAGTTQTDDNIKRALALRGQMLSIFPELDGVKITHTWAGFVAYTFDVLPHITEHDGIHYVGGCCGSGVVMQPFLGHKVAMKALGMKDEARTIFDKIYKAVPGYFGKPWFMPAIMLYFSLKDRLPG